MTGSVLIPSFNRPAALRQCLAALIEQTVRPTEVFVVWQGEDSATREAAAEFADRLPMTVLHSPECGVVPAENLALDASRGEVVLLIDDDAIAPRNWVERHLSFYADARVGAVGGPAVNHRPVGTPFPIHAAEPIGRESWAGVLRGNMYDQPAEWRTRPARRVDHLVGYNFSLRRSAFDRFEIGLRRYWQLFEWDACLQVRGRGFEVMFDFANVVDHHPTNTAYVGGRDGDLTVKMFNAAYNHGFIVGKHYGFTRRTAAMLRQAAIGSVAVPGIAGMLVGTRRFGRPTRELSLMVKTLAAWREGCRDGRRRRS